jgi:glycosyltransferase involved in cell wall biosynthesis
VIACDPEQRDRLAARGFRDLYVVPTPVDTTAVPREPAPPHPPWSLVAGSAPWTRRQFATKGVDLLLGAARRRADLTLTFLWRGVLEEPMGRRERRAGLGERLRVVHERAQVGRLLAASHAAVVLAARPRLVKAYPHSLLEALAASRPILASACLPIASWAEGAGCGVAVRELTPTALDRALEELADRYGELQQGAAALDLTDRSPARYREAVAAIYARACEARP